eukprot:711704-Pyramimonas_sp.AAC.1
MPRGLRGGLGLNVATVGFSYAREPQVAPRKERHGALVGDWALTRPLPDSVPRASPPLAPRKEQAYISLQKPSIKPIRNLRLARTKPQLAFGLLTWIQENSNPVLGITCRLL